MSTEAREAKKVQPRARRKGRLWDIQKTRYIVQLGFALFIAWVMYQHITIGEDGPIITASPEAYCPLGGFETLFKFVTTGKFVSHTHLSNVVLFAGLLATAVVAKSYFCGWICPFGAIQQALTASRRWLQRRISPLDKLARWLDKRSQRIAFLDRWLRYGKYLMLIWIVWGTITYGKMVFRDIDPWAALLTIAEPEKGLAFLVLIGVLVAAFVGDRVWCRYLCPLSPIVGLVGKISPIKIQREASACNGCAICSKKCPMDIPVHTQSRVSAVECNMCLHCVESCPARGALELRFILPGARRQEDERRVA